MRFVTMTAIVCVLSLVRLAVAQAVESPNDPDRAVGQQVLDKDAGVRERAIQQIRAAENRPDAAAGALRRYWLVPMGKAGFNDDIARMTLACILKNPQSQLTVESLLRPRVYALIALSRPDEALADAKRFYNVCRLEETGVAVDLLVVALRAKYGQDAETQIRQFHMSQMLATGAATNSGTKAASGQAASTGLIPATIDGAPYLAEAGKRKNNRRQWMAYGNLLLLAGDASGAYAYFTARLNESRTDGDLITALERQAAATRAEDGNVARAQGVIHTLAAE